MARIITGIVRASLILALVNPTVHPAIRLGEDGPRIYGFSEVAFGGKLGNDSTKRDEYNMLEERFQFRTTFYPEFLDVLSDWQAELNFRGDFSLDQYFGSETDFDLRELNLVLSPLSFMDVKLGRQVFTWGTGDYLFINDLFPKDYISFFIGRDDEYLKRPNDGIKLSLYSEAANIDFLAFSFEPNSVASGERLSFFDPFLGGISGRESERYLSEPARQFENLEHAVRIYRNIGSYEAALYTFRGYYKNPQGVLNQMSRTLFYPRLDAYGSSLRGPALGGIGNLEFGYYNSRQDSNGDNRLIANSSFRFLAGYSKDLGNDLSVGVQYLYEQTLDYGAYQRALRPGDFVWDKHRHLTTFRVSKLFKNQTVRANLFVFFSPSDRDGYLRPSIDYDVNDRLKLTLGANLAWGDDDHTEFGQMENNKNVYLRVRYSF